jgi:hypothetical protein
MESVLSTSKLLSDINLKIDNDLRKLTQNSDPNSIPVELERLGIFQKAFQTYIDDTVLYNTILERMRANGEIFAHSESPNNRPTYMPFSCNLYALS